MHTAKRNQSESFIQPGNALPRGGPVRSGSEEGILYGNDRMLGLEFMEKENPDTTEANRE